MVTLFGVFGYIYRCGYIAWYILVNIIVVVTLLVLNALVFSLIFQFFWIDLLCLLMYSIVKPLLILNFYAIVIT